MKKMMLLLGAVLCISYSQAQETKITFEVNYPKVIGDNSFHEAFDGRGDVGVKWRFAEMGNLQLGLGLNTGWYAYETEDTFLLTDLTINSYTVEPKLFLEYYNAESSWFRPYLGVGYNWMKFDFKGTALGRDFSKEEECDSGIGANLGLAFYLTNRWFVQSVFNYTYLLSDNFIDTSSNSHIMQLKFGIGFNF